jgi:GTPase SAR1 family protein
MGCVSSKAIPLRVMEDSRNRIIENAQRKAELHSSSVIELIILGTGDSGKTTLRKQLANVHNKTFEDLDYRATFASTIIVNLIDGVLEILYEMGRSTGILFDETIAYLSEIARIHTPSILDKELAFTLMRFVHHEEEFKKFATTQRVQLQDCWFVFAEKLKDYPNWGGPGWIPSADDCVRSRVRTSGIIREDLRIDGLPFVIYDVGGQRAERRKWMHMFDNVLSYIYVAALSEYDQVLFEDRTKNRLEEALELFSETVNSPWFTRATILLFLNKKDLFHKKFSIQRVPLNITGSFPSAPEDNDDEEGAIRWISNQFTIRKRQILPKGVLGSKVFVHVTTATDPSNIKAVFQLATETILKRNMRAVGLT